MVKKKYFLYLSMLLLMLFIGLSGTCYAFEINNGSEFESYVREALIDYPEGQVKTYLLNFLDSDAWEFNKNQITWSMNNMFVMRLYQIDNNRFGIGIWYYPTEVPLNVLEDYVIQPYQDYSVTGSRMLFKCNYNQSNYEMYLWTSNDVTWNNQATGFSVRANYNNSSLIFTTDTIINPYNYDIYGIFNQYQEVLEFQQTPSSTEISLLSVSDIPVYQYDYNGFNLGKLVDSENVALWLNDNLEVIYYVNNGWNGQYDLMHREFYDENGEFIKNIWSSNRYIDIQANDDFTEYQYFVKQPTQFKNALLYYHLEYTEDFENIDSINVYWYIRDNTTVISNGTIDTTNLSNNDNYLNQFKDLPIIQNNNENTDNIINNLNDDDNVNSIISASLSSGDILAKLQFQQYHISGDDIVYNLFTNIADVLLDDEDVYFDYSMHGEPPTRIYASAFTTPDNKLTQFIRIFLVFVVMYGIYYNIKHIIDLINEGKAALILEDEDVDVMLYKM